MEIIHKHPRYSSRFLDQCNQLHTAFCESIFRIFFLSDNEVFRKSKNMVWNFHFTVHYQSEGTFPENLCFANCAYSGKQGFCLLVLSVWCQLLCLACVRPYPWKATAQQQQTKVVWPPATFFLHHLPSFWGGGGAPVLQLRCGYTQVFNLHCNVPHV